MDGCKIIRWRCGDALGIHGIHEDDVIGAAA